MQSSSTVFVPVRGPPPGPASVQPLVPTVCRCLLQDRSCTLAALVAAKEAEAAAVREQLCRAPMTREQSAGSGAPMMQHGGPYPLSAAVTLPQPVQQIRQPSPPSSTQQVGWHARA